MNTQQDNRDYHKLYMKYKAKYLSLRNDKVGGQVRLDLIDDDYLNMNSLEGIFIRVTDSTSTGLAYEKVIKVKSMDEKGTISTKDYESNKKRTRDINRGDVEKLVKDINKLWKLPKTLGVEWTDTSKNWNRDFDEENEELDDYNRYPSRDVDNPDDYSKFSLYVKVGNRIWSNSRADNMGDNNNNKQRKSKMSRVEQRDLYSDIVSQILSFG